MTKRTIASVVVLAVLLGLACRISGVWNATEQETPIPAATVESPFKLAPDRLDVPVGAVARLDVSRTQTNLAVSFDWSIDGLPPGAEAEFSTGTGYPVDGVLLIRTAGSTPPGTYPLEVTLSTDASSWSQLIVLEVTSCEENVQTGTFVTKTRVVHLAGGPSTLTYGNGSPMLVFCESETPRRLIVRVESVTDDQGETWPRTDATLTLYRLLDWPLPDEISEIVTENRDDRNAESVAAGEDGVLTWDITPGAFVIYFPQHQFQDTPSAVGEFDADISVTYRLDVMVGRE